MLQDKYEKIYYKKEQTMNIPKSNRNTQIVLMTSFILEAFLRCLLIPSGQLYVR